MSKIEVDTDLCIGCGACIEACPECFKLGDDDGKSHVIAQACDCDLDEVAVNCPVQAITIVKEG
jgi:ferredoxin